MRLRRKCRRGVDHGKKVWPRKRGLSSVLLRFYFRIAVDYALIELLANIGVVGFESRRIGQRIDWPQGHKAITLRGSENLKMACFFVMNKSSFPPMPLAKNSSARIVTWILRRRIR